ncbi:ComEC family protein [Yokenella regensburgei]|uniref:ComEC family protein n=1 Tax=Yokenella regensburgei TaxID=158877 RepID=UPI003F150E5F
MTLPALAMCLNLGLIPLLFLPKLPGLHFLWWMIAAACVLAGQRRRILRYAGFALLFFAWGVLAARQQIWPMAFIPGSSQKVKVVITDTDRATTHFATITHLNGKRLYPAPGIVFYGQYLPEAVCAGQQWEMVIRARAIHGQLNAGGFDTQRHALSIHQPLTGRFITARAISSECSRRGLFVNSLTKRLEPFHWQAVILALGLGERTSLDAETKDIMRETGTAHLMAISGLHIALTAVLGGLFARGIQFFFPAHWINWRLPLYVGVIFAIYYAWLTGMQPPAFRTAISLGVWAGLRLSGRQWSPWQVWGCCVAGILFVDPVAILSQSLWLSAFAVAALIFWYQWLPLRTKSMAWWYRGLVNLIYLQVGMTLLLLPLQILSFHGVSVSSLVANLLAVPLVTLITVPLILMGMLLHLTGPHAIETLLWLLADGSLDFLFWFLHALPPGWLNVDARWLAMGGVPWVVLILLRLQLFRSVPGLCLVALSAMLIPLFRYPTPDTWRVHMLDVGQGLAMVIERNGKAILYDTGLAWPGGDSAKQLIIPWLRWHHLEPEGIILSHDHLDHRGGLDTLMRLWPALWVRSPVNSKNYQPCWRGEKWQWQGLTFTAHWPLRDSRMGGNNLSCVVKVEEGKHSILLTGDIETSAELAMLRHYWQHLAASVIQVPHHGSNTSSTLPFIQRVNGAAALVSASRYNAWRLPSEKVKNRYLQEGYKWYDTPHHGQITVQFSPDTWTIVSLREHIFPRWYHQWFGVPGDNG